MTQQNTRPHEQASYDTISSTSSTLSPDTPLDICTFKIEAPSGSGPNKVRVNVKQDVSGIITLSSAQSMEEVPPDPEPEAKEGDETKTDAATEPKEGEVRNCETRSDHILIKEQH